MVLDPVHNPDWKIAQEAEKHMKPVAQVAEELGLLESEVLPYGKYMAKIDQKAVRSRLSSAPQAKYVDVTAITPTHWVRENPPQPLVLSKGLPNAANVFPRPSVSLRAGRPWV